MILAKLKFSDTFSNKVNNLINKDFIKSLNREDMCIIYELFRSGSLSPSDLFWSRLIKDKSNTISFLRFISKINKFKTNEELLNYLKKNKLNELYEFTLEFIGKK